ncbi:beta-ketoacyl synthase N-terminal-like domain-containing protein [Salegentibacter sp. F188]|uniref:Beta-ketoacyl synthase N-terminal-like domain-containing protein n=1 Tax=Autumnicola patrickiae TaxID=3075591 RepID=A0ABU3E439_9FLAO|nr:beta-ketoacyl synthase N-terminal-like domain-containing protein [Salegentibacter sp. F188]MDT0690736.1 beta-ketoacyl synthase N-terminal-like domain-containing protein [Salegentibacter sp. F188]
MKKSISITSMASVSPLGKTSEENWENYLNLKHHLSKGNFGENEAYAGFLPKKLAEEVEKLRAENVNYRHIDKSVLFAILSAREAMKKAGWENDKNIGINIGSSRGATELFEKYHTSFLENGKGETLASPTTTLGNISSWVGQDLETTGPEFSHSVTCSTGLHAVLNGIAWIQAELSDKFLVGGSEAALTPFTMAQMKAMKIYASEDLDYPCQALNMDKSRNSMVLGEGAAMICMEAGNAANAIAQITGMGYATEKLKHSVSISANGECMQDSMKMAMAGKDPSDIDVVVTHTPGTIKGDLAEINAIKEVFGKELPAITCNKWKIGHTFAASGNLSLEMAILMLQHQQFLPVPFSEFDKVPQKLENILVNAVGFGGNAVSILVSR